MVLGQLIPAQAKGFSGLWKRNSFLVDRPLPSLPHLRARLPYHRNPKTACPWPRAEGRRAAENGRARRERARPFVPFRGATPPPPPPPPPPCVVLRLRQSEYDLKTSERKREGDERKNQTTKEAEGQWGERNTSEREERSSQVTKCCNGPVLTGGRLVNDTTVS